MRSHAFWMMVPILGLVAFVAVAPLGAESRETDLAGRWKRESGAVLEAVPAGTGGTWNLVLVQPAPGAPERAKASLGKAVATGLRWLGNGRWGKGKTLADPRGNQYDCEVALNSDGHLVLRVSAFLTGRTEILTRVSSLD